ncbi:MAG: hypothetical protein HKP56_10480 [Anderseniella sp.]|nr:hypothetical protein [Anderseniella sp.]
MNQSANGTPHPPVLDDLVKPTTSAPIWKRFFPFAPLILAATGAAIALVQKLCGLHALNSLRRSTRIEPNPFFDELSFSRAAST